MIVPFKQAKDVSYIFSVCNNEDMRIVGVNEDQHRKYCNIRLKSLEELKSVIDPIHDYMEHNSFGEELEMIPFDEIISK